MSGGKKMTWREFFDSAAPTYGGAWTIEEEIRLAAARAVAAAAPFSGALVEIGCGNGRMLRNLPAACIGVDLSWRMLLEARRRVPSARLVRADATRLPFRQGVVAAAVIVNMLHVNPDERAILAELARLAPRALFVDFRNGLNPIVILKNLLHAGPDELRYRSHMASAWKTVLRGIGYGAVRLHRVARPLSDPAEGFALRHVVGAMISLLPGLAPCYLLHGSARGASEPGKAE